MRRFTMLRWMWMLCLLLAAPASAQESDEGASDEETTDEPAAEGEGAPGEGAAPEAETEVEAEPEAEPQAEPQAEPAPQPEPAPEPEPAPQSEPAPAPEPVATPDPEAEAYAMARSEAASKRAKWKAHKNKAMKAPQLALFLGGQRLHVGDPGWGTVADDPWLESFSGGFDIWVHPNIAASLAWSDSNELSDVVTDEFESGTLRVTTRVRTFDGGVKAALAPRWMIFRPTLRAAFGVRGVDLDVVDSSVSGNLKGRQASGAAPYGRFGGGFELVTPTYFGEGHRDKGATKRLRWGAGFMLEGGAEIGGGGELPAAASVDLGEFGRLDFGPWYLRAGLLILF